MNGSRTSDFSYLLSNRLLRLRSGQLEEGAMRRLVLRDGEHSEGILKIRSKNVKNVISDQTNSQ